MLNQLGQQSNKRVYRPPLGILNSKNRHPKVLPHTHTRVELLTLNNDKSSTDYINASFIRPDAHRLDGCRHTYIAAAAPLPSCSGDFWRMLYEQRVGLVVLLTRCQEGPSCKAHAYWPKYPKVSDTKSTKAMDSLDERQAVPGTVVSDSAAAPRMTVCDNMFEVVSKLKERKNSTVLRTLSLSKLPRPLSGVGSPASSDPVLRSTAPAEPAREVHILQYVGWPDHGAPLDMDDFVQVYANYRRLRRRFEKDQPVVVQCSAGIGRTGTFIALDILIDHLLFAFRRKVLTGAHPAINIFSLVQALREARGGMVQTKAQYMFIAAFVDHCLTQGLFIHDVP